MESLVLLVIPFIVLGFVLKVNPLLIVVSAGILAGILGGFDWSATSYLEAFLALDWHLMISKLGKFFVDNRYAGLTWLILPLLGVLETNGIRERARIIIANIKAATTGRIMMVYFVFRQITAMLGLLSLGGQAQMVRPLVSPMAEASARNKFPNLSEKDTEKIKAYCAATDNVALFFGEDVFIAIQSILLIKGFFDGLQISLEPFELSIWAIPTAVTALIVYAIQMVMLDRNLERKYQGALR